MRWLFAILGLAALGYGGVQFVDFLSAGFAANGPVLGWLIAGPVLHDALLAPLVGLVGLLITRAVPARWRWPVGAATAASAVLVFLAVPLLWRPYGGSVNPGLHDANYPVQLAVALGACWLIAILVGLVRSLLARRAARHPTTG
ncbi:hypothetical protein EV191_10587 [Tamaricihabitans halophyticus]|uniref:Uncharacterized protein n=1 Tax=Tamaricihabitans halophyticus TaxID=1262583 RepID=A0A4R2R0U2_9PSEU|nr:hypothetical protein [Tamaricihabitans halophyticus]TCP53025.1 hypothetical protein EV191_10587 [Tamaricihabitans halophyticus]